MAGILRRSTSRITFVLLLLSLSLALTAQRAAAFDGAENKDKDASDSSRPPAATAAPSIAYAVFTGAMEARPEVKPAGTLARVHMPKVAATPLPATMPLPPRAPAVSTAPMTVGEKFHYWIKSSFLSPGAYGQSAFTGLWNELLDNDEGKEDTVGNYFADASTRMARSIAFRATSGFFEKFAYASILRQDPRYHRSGKRGVGGKLGYAVTRVFITQGDRCGCDQPNVSYLAGGLTAAFIANQWERDERATTGKAINRWVTHIAITMLGNVIKEFVGGQ